MNDFKEVSIWILVLIYFLILLFIPVVTYGAGYSDGFNSGYQKCLVDFNHKAQK